MPNRIIKESIHTSEDVNMMTDFQFRLWVSLITYVDDFGRGDARPAIIKGSCFPLRDRITNKDIEAALRALAGIGCVSLYEVDGKPYLYFPTWESHQTVRNQKSKYPVPAEGQQLQAIESNCKQLKANVPVIQSESESESNPNPKEGVRAARFTPPAADEVRDYCRERGNSVDAERFVDFYTAKGWKVGKNPMKDWKAAVRTWEKEDGDGKRRSQPRGVDREEAQRSDSKWGITYST